MLFADNFTTLEMWFLFVGKEDFRVKRVVYATGRTRTRSLRVIRGLRDLKMSKMRATISVFLLERLNLTLLLLQIYLQFLVLTLNPKQGKLV